MYLLDWTGTDPHGLHAVVVGRSGTVGKPTAFLLLNAHATVTIAHSRTADLAEVTRPADIIVSATGSGTAKRYSGRPEAKRARPG